jgi:hypothetical protein
MATIVTRKPPVRKPKEGAAVKEFKAFNITLQVSSLDEADALAEKLNDESVTAYLAEKTKAYR